MVAKVSGNVNVSPAGPDGIKEAVPRSPHNGDSVDFCIKVSSDADSLCGGWNSGCDPLGEGIQAGGFAQAAYAANADVSGVSARDQRLSVDESNTIGEGISNATRGSVGIGVGGIEADSGGDEPVNDSPFEVGGRNTVDTAQVQGMVGDNKVSTPFDGLINNGGDGVNRKKDFMDGGAGVSSDETNGIPSFCRVRRVQGVKYVDGFTQGQRARGQ
jgi:hypothetical protein